MNSKKIVIKIRFLTPPQKRRVRNAYIQYNDTPFAGNEYMLQQMIHSEVDHQSNILKKKKYNMMKRSGLCGR